MTNAPPYLNLASQVVPVPPLVISTFAIDPTFTHPELRADTNLLLMASNNIANGMFAAGWRTIQISDGSFNGVDAQGNLVPDPGLYPDLPRFARQLHTIGYKIEYYTADNGAMT